MDQETFDTPEKRQQGSFDLYIERLLSNESVNDRDEQLVRLPLAISGTSEALRIAAHEKAEFIAVGKIYKKSEIAMLGPAYFAEFAYPLDDELNHLRVTEYVSTPDDFFCRQRTFVLDSVRFRVAEIAGKYMDPQESIQDNIKRHIESPEVRPAHDPERFNAVNQILHHLAEYYA